MTNLAKMTIAELKSYATETHGLTFRSKALKADIIAAIEDAATVLVKVTAQRPIGDATRVLSEYDRVGNYSAQLGNMSGKLTARQERRVNKKIGYAMAHSSEYKLTRAL